MEAVADVAAVGTKEAMDGQDILPLPLREGGKGRGPRQVRSAPSPNPLPQGEGEYIQSLRAPNCHHSTALPNRPCGRITRTMSIGRNSTT
jgi:hypothetical protein